MDDHGTPPSTDLFGPGEARAQHDTPVSRGDDARIRGLLRMPAELIELITEYLSLEDFRQFRLANRHINDVSFDIFGTRFFAYWAVSLVFDQLQRLNQIAEHPFLSKKMKNLRIRSDYKLPANLFERSRAAWFENLPKHGDQLRHATESWRQFAERVDNMREHHKLMRSSGLASSFLARALPRLENLEFLGTFHDFYYQSDQVKQMWTDSRVPQLDSRFDFSPGDLEECIDPRLVKSSELDIIVSAVHASRSKVPRLGFNDGAFVVKTSTPRSDGPEAVLLQNCLRSVIGLHLSLSLSSKSEVDYTPWFLAAAPETLENLYITAAEVREKYRPAPFFNEIFRIRRFSNLTKVCFQFPADSFTHLVQFIRNHRSSLKSCTLICQRRYSGWDSRGMKWSKLARACLEAQNLDCLHLETGSSLYISKGHGEALKFIGAIMKLSENVPGRAELEQRLARWEALERAAGL